MEQDGNTIQSVGVRQSSDPNSTSSISEAEQINAALAKLKDPPRAGSLVGTVVNAGQQPSPASDVVVRVSEDTTLVHAAIAQPTPHRPPLLASSPATSVTKGPLAGADLKQLSRLLYSTKPANLDGVQSAHVIAPTAPDADAAIPKAAAEVAYEEQLARQEEESKHIKAAPAAFVEPSIKMRPLYMYGGLWLSAIPVALILYMLSGVIPGGRSPGIVDFVFMVVEYALGLYGLVGWVPLVLLYRKSVRGGI